MKTQKWLLGMVLVLCLCWPSAAWAVVDAPAQGYVGDYANVLTDETEQYIIEQNAKLDQATGAQLVVVTVDFLDGMTAEEYAYQIFNQWGIGDKEKNNGLLLLLAIGEEDYWAMQGKGLEGILSSGTLGDYLYEYLEPDFAVGEYDAGVRKVFDAFLGWYMEYYQLDLQGLPTATGSNQAVATGPEQRQQGGGGWLWIVLLFVVIVILISMNNRRKDRRRKNDHWRGGGGGSGYGYDKTVIPRAPRRGIYMPPRGSAPRSSSRSRSGGSLFGGGSSRGGGAGRSSGGFGRSMGRSSGSFRGFGGGGSRGGGAGRR